MAAVVGFGLLLPLALNIGPIITPSASPSRWDAACVANPVILPPRSGTDESWLCFYYGNRGGYGDAGGGWAGGEKCFLPTGWCGMATSADGLDWSPVDGANDDGSIFAPNDNTDAWDGLHVGVGDVVRLRNETLVMFYLGGSNEPPAFGPAGIKMRIGRALSEDGGLSWRRDASPVVDIDPAEGLFASWPRVLTPNGEDGEWYMTYHAFNGSHWNVYSATSNDQGASWDRQGRVLSPGAEGSFDSSGIGTRAMCEWRGKWLMCFEGVGGGGPFAGKHRLGVATSDDQGKTWQKVTTLDGAPNPGGPIVEPGGPGAWTEQVVGTPYLLPMEGGALRLYFCAKTAQTNMSIGCLESESGDLAMEAWKPLAADMADDDADARVSALQAQLDEKTAENEKLGLKVAELTEALSDEVKQKNYHFRKAREFYAELKELKASS